MFDFMQPLGCSRTDLFPMPLARWVTLVKPEALGASVFCSQKLEDNLRGPFQL